VPTGETEELQCGLVLRAIGYRGEPVPGVPFDERLGRIPNEGGRVSGARGEYAVGWIKRGPTGVIGTNKKDAADTVARILEDREAGALNEPPRDDAEHWLHEKVPGVVTWDGWRAIDEHETRLGEPAGRPRVKLVSVEEMRRIGSRR
jgi:ferredoxin--NADP+ reductase